MDDEQDQDPHYQELKPSDSSSDSAANVSTRLSRSSSRASLNSQRNPDSTSATRYAQTLRSPAAAHGGPRALQSPASRQNDSQELSHKFSAANSPYLASYEIPLMANQDTERMSLSGASAVRTQGSKHSDAASEGRRVWRRRAEPSAVSAHSSTPSCGSSSQLHSRTPGSCNLDVAEMECRMQDGLGDALLPSCNYYLDRTGQLRVRKLWWCYTRLRRVLWCVFPWLKRDSNTFLSARMIAHSTLIVVVYFVREFLNHVVLPAVLRHREGVGGDDDVRNCRSASLGFLDMDPYTLVANVLLCLPALNFKACRLYRSAQKDSSSRGSTSSNAEASAVVAPSSSLNDIVKEHQRYEKTYMFTLCELIVVIEIPFLVYTFICIFVSKPDSGSVVDLLTACDRELATGYFIVLLGIESVGVIAYVLRWRQILLFHRIHQHFLFQRGYVPGHSRFDYVERSFATPLYAWLPAPIWALWRRCTRSRNAAQRNPFRSPQHAHNDSIKLPEGSAKKQVHYIKVELYGAAKRGDVEQVKLLLDAAVSIAGPDFATAWYTPRTWKIDGMILIARGQRNPLHVAVAFDQIEVVRELLANGHFDVQQLDKLELLRVDLAWIYRLMFRVLFFVARRSSVGVTGTAGGSGGSGSAAPGLASASHPFGPVGLLQATLLTPLHVAVTLGHAELTLLLLRYGAKPDGPALSTHPRFATAPLYWAVDKECTRLLLDAGANPLALPVPGGGNGLLLTAFEVARIAGNAAVARQMEKYGGDVALTPLHDACAGGRRQEVAFLLDHGADPNALGEQVVGCFRRTPLHWAAMRGHARIIRILLRYGASVDAQDIFGRTPLAWACVLNRARAVEALLESGANVDVRDAQGDPLLCICAAGACASIKRGAKTFAGKRDKLGDDHIQDDENDVAGDEDGGIGDMLSGKRSLARGLDPRIFQLLLDHGVDLQATRASNGDTALHVALRRRNQAAAVLFVRAGLSLTAVNLLGQRAIDCARSPALRFAVKKEAGQRDVMISYSHAHTPLACKLRDALERARVTTWIDSMGPTGIMGGSVWRQEIARGIQSSALVLAVLTKDYPQSQWCMKELAFAKMQNVPVVAIQCEDMEISEELQVYLWTRQVIDFRPAIKQHYTINNIPTIPYSPPDDRNDTDDEARADSRTASNSSHTMVETDYREDETGDTDGVPNMSGKRISSSLELMPDYNDDAFRHCLRMLLDGIQDQIEEHRARLARRQEQQQQQSLLPGGEAGANAGLANDRMNSRRESRAYTSECTPEEEDKALEKVCASERTEYEDQPAEIKFPEGPLNVPLFRPLRRIESGASSLAFASLADTDSYVFIAHGDFHHAFCMRLQRTLLKQNIRCVVDQTVPAVQYAHQSPSAANADTTQAQSDGFGAALRAIDQPVARLPVQTRQLAAKDAILSCSAVLVVLSPLSANCDLLADQLAFAEDRGKLLVPVLLSLHNVDLAKRYTFSRSLVHHFNMSLGFEQSVEQLSNHLRVQQQNEARQRRLERRQQDQGELNAGSGPMAVLSPISSVSSAESRPSSLAAYTDVIEVQSPFDDVLLNSADSSLLLPPLPVRSLGLNTSTPGSRAGSHSSFGGHGWSESDAVEADRHDDAQVFQQDNLHHQDAGDEHSRRSRTGSHSSSTRTSSRRSRSRESSGYLIAPPRYQHGHNAGAADDIV